ncbi:MAG: hypothetical protein ACK55I_19625, partial [bacterium]
GLEGGDPLEGRLELLGIHRGRLGRKRLPQPGLQQLLVGRQAFDLEVELLELGHHLALGGQAWDRFAGARARRGGRRRRFGRRLGQLPEGVQPFGHVAQAVAHHPFVPGRVVPPEHLESGLR